MSICLFLFCLFVCLFFCFLSLGLWQNSFYEVIKYSHIFKSTSQNLWRITLLKFSQSFLSLGYRRSGVSRCDIRWLVPDNCSGTIVDSSERVQNLVKMQLTCNIARNNVLSRNHIFIVTYLLCWAVITFLQYTCSWYCNCSV